MNGQRIYLDRAQCEYFGAKYFAPDQLTVAADALLDSKGGDGYDAEHRAILEPLGQRQIQAQRELTDSPGWYTITATL